MGKVFGWFARLPFGLICSFDNLWESFVFMFRLLPSVSVGVDSSSLPFTAVGLSVGLIRLAALLGVDISPLFSFGQSS